MRSPDRSPPRRQKRQFDNSPPAKPEKMLTTLDGKKAGLQDASSMREEGDMRRKRNDEMIRKMMEQDKTESK